MLKIRSRRGYYSHPSWHIVFDWEDVISEKMTLPIVLCKQNRVAKFFLEKANHLLYFIMSLIDNKLGSKGTPSSYNFSFYMYPLNPEYIPLNQRKSIIPYIIDGFTEKERLKKLYSVLKKHPIIFISSIEMYDYLCSIKCPLNIEQVSLSLPDKYKLETQCLKKEYDVITLGRMNPVLEIYLKQYLIENTHVEWIYQKDTQNGNYVFYSNKRGEIGTAASRDAYMQVLRKSKISLYSTPGMDGSRNTHGFNPVTPKYLELLSSQCQLIMRYPDTEETRFFGMSEIAPHTETYKDFKEQMDAKLVDKVDLSLYSSVLDKHYTSKRVIEFENLLKKYI